MASVPTRTGPSSEIDIQNPKLQALHRAVDGLSDEDERPLVILLDSLDAPRTQILRCVSERCLPPQATPSGQWCSRSVRVLTIDPTSIPAATAFSSSRLRKNRMSIREETELTRAVSLDRTDSATGLAARAGCTTSAPQAPTAPTTPPATMSWTKSEGVSAWDREPASVAPMATIAPNLIPLPTVAAVEIPPDAAPTRPALPTAGPFQSPVRAHCHRSHRLTPLTRCRFYS